jgi:4-hydroxy-tetrahydrodipicolinate synthase
VVYIAAITPRDGKGEIEVGAAFELVDYLCAALKGHGGAIVLFDAAGEYPALDAAERSRVLRLAVKRSRVPVLAGVGGATLDVSLELAREARDAGVDALLLPPPYFYPYGQAEIHEFYTQFSAQMQGTPVFLEHLPEFTSGVAIDTARELLATGQFAGIMDSTGEHIAAGLDAVVANDRMFAKARCAGSAALSAAACAAPELVLALDCAVAASKADEVEQLNLRLQELLDWFELLPPFTLLRVATGLRGIKAGPPAMPVPAEKRKIVTDFKEWFKSWA